MADKMPAWGVPGETPEEGEWPARDRVPFVPEDAFNKLATHLIEDGVVGVKDGKLITAAEMYLSPGEAAARDRVPFVTMDEFHEKTGHRFAAPIGLRPAEVTEEMIEAGEEADFSHSSEVRYPAIYRAMHAAAPVPLVSDAEIAALAWNRAGDETISTLRDELDRARAELTKERAWTMRLGVDHTSLTVENRLLRAELMAAHDRLAKFTAQNAAEPEAPDPIANALRPRETERRRVGG